MSDYLWDGTGEPEEDVRQLEELLGSLAYQPRPLELPEPLIRQARVNRSFAWTRAAAIAAALILTLLAGAALMSIRRRAEAPVQQATGQQSSPAPFPVNTPQSDSPQVSKENEEVAIQTSNNPPEVKRHRRQPRPATSLAAASANGQRKPTSRRLNETRAPVNEEIAQNGAPAGGRELTAEERRAKDQLMLALRVASANLRYAQEQVHEVGMGARPR